jgi:hypothetical protein
MLRLIPALAFSVFVTACTSDVFMAGDAGGDAEGVGDASHADVSLDAKADDGAYVSSDGCTETTFYLDGDQDGWGGTTTAMACSSPGTFWVTQGGDCDDSNATVHPGQASFFTVGYVPTGKTETSFDYNCDGTEEESGSSPKANCAVDVTTCIGAGYIEAMPVRTGPGVDAYCASASTVTCTYEVTSCPESTPQAASAIACH